MAKAKRQHKLTVMLSKQELAELRVLADLVGLGLSDWVRQAIRFHGEQKVARAAMAARVEDREIDASVLARS